MAKKENLFIENAEIIFKNFRGKEGKFNRAGERSFGVFIDDPDLLDAMQREGWTIKTYRARSEEEMDRYYINVKVSYLNSEPEISMINGDVGTYLDESTVGQLDFAEFDNVDLSIYPYHYSFNGREGIKGYLDAGYFTVKPNLFQEKYKHVRFNSNSVDAIEEMKSDPNVGVYPTDEELPFN